MRVNLSVAALALLAAPLCFSEDDGASRFSGTLGLGVAAIRDYEGGGKSRTGLASLVSIEAATRLGTFALGDDGLSWTPIDGDALRAGLLVGYDPGRTSSNRTGGDYRPGSSFLKGMGDVAGTPEAGAFIGWDFGDHAAVNLSVLHGVGDKGHGGTLVAIDATVPIHSGESLQLALQPGIAWTDADYAQTYFGVTPAQAAASGFAIYRPQAGLKSAQLDLVATYALTPRWSVMATASYHRLMGDAENSPIVQRSGYTEFGAFVAWNFGRK